MALSQRKAVSEDTAKAITKKYPNLVVGKPSAHTRPVRLPFRGNDGKDHAGLWHEPLNLAGCQADAGDDETTARVYVKGAAIAHQQALKGLYGERAATTEAGEPATVDDFG